MKKPNWGGRRRGAGSGGPRPGAGRPQTRFSFGSIGDQYVIERGAVDDVPGPPEKWEIVLVTDNYFELQRTVDGTSEILTISKLKQLKENDMSIQYFKTKQEAEEEKGKLRGWNAVVSREYQPEYPEAYENGEDGYLYAIAAKNEGRLVYLRTDGYFR